MGEVDREHAARFQTLLARANDQEARQWRERAPRLPVGERGLSLTLALHLEEVAALRSRLAEVMHGADLATP